MNKSILIFGIVILFLSACTEKGPLIIFKPSAAKDTFYTTTPETPQAHNVLIEEFTGARCPNCPSGHEAIYALMDANHGRINAIALHVNDFILAQPVNNSTYDFRTAAATSIETQFYGSVGQEPRAGIDRTPVGGNLLLDLPWGTAATNRLSATNAVNLYVQSSYDANSREASIQAKIAYTAVDTNSEYLSVAIVEDSLYDKQYNTSGTIPNYLFNNIMRDLVTPVTGTKIIPTLSSKPAGMVNIINYKYTLDTAWAPKHCRVIAFVSRGGASIEVLQSAQAPIAP